MSEFKYQVRISPRSRHIRVCVTPQRGMEVVIPRGYDPERVPALLKRKQRWIRNALARVAPLLAHSGPENGWQIPEQIRLPALGLVWTVIVRSTKTAARTSVRETGAGQLLISGDIGDEQSCRAALARWLMRQAHRHLVPGLERVSRELRLPYTRACIRLQKTRWGSCSRDGAISLNAKLLFLAPETVRYVMIHELCHRLELNHSPRFWRLLERHCPEYRRINDLRRDLWKAVPHWADAT